MVEVRTFGTSGSAEYSFKIDEGLWTDFRPLNDNGLLVSHSRFLLQGKHVIHVRARIAEDPHGISSVKDVGFMGQASYRPAQVALRDELLEPSGEALRPGCSATGALEFLALGALTLLRRRRRRN